MTTAHRPLLVTGDTGIHDEVMRLAAAAGTRVDIAADPASARRGWQDAPLVLVGADVVSRCAQAALPPRRGVAVVCRDSPPPALWPAAIGCGADRVLALPDGEPALVDLLADSVEPDPEPARVVAVLAGRGGAGATVLATALAVTAARAGRCPLLVDLDPAGGGIDLTMGAENAPGPRWNDLATTSGRVSASALREALPRAHGTSVLSFGRDNPVELTAEAVRSVVTAGRRMGGPVVLDLPRYDTPARAAALRLTDTVLLVVPAELRAVAAAARVTATVSPVVGDVRAVIRRAGVGGIPSADVAGALCLRLAGELRTEPGLAGALERGDPPARRGRGPLAALCGQLLGVVAPGRAEAAA
ncbi:MAG TPA: septum site-determining protein Ssd [Mycobacteriales bacterium]|nr:septum site-determining protein Ssd [Mycobacteriales bacterium]